MSLDGTRGHDVKMLSGIDYNIKPDSKVTNIGLWGTGIGKFYIIILLIRVWADKSNINCCCSEACQPTHVASTINT